jgi:hypothetical protein
MRHSCITRALLMRQPGRVQPQQVRQRAHGRSEGGASRQGRAGVQAGQVCRHGRCGGCVVETHTVETHTAHHAAACVVTLMVNGAMALPRGMVCLPGWLPGWLAGWLASWWAEALGVTFQIQIVGVDSYRPFLTKKTNVAPERPENQLLLCHPSHLSQVPDLEYWRKVRECHNCHNCRSNCHNCHNNCHNN